MATRGGQRRSAAGDRGVEQLGEGGAVDVLEDERDVVVLDQDVDHAHYVRVMDAGRERRLSQRRAPARGVADEIRVRAFDRDAPAEALWPEPPAEVDRAAAPGAQLALDGVAPRHRSPPPTPSPSPPRARPYFASTRPR